MFKLYTKTANFLKNYPWFGEVFVFLVMLALYLPLQAGAAFADPDSFYHLKMAELIMGHGPLKTFGWLPFTTLASSYADHHFLYHVALIPFVKIFGSLAGMKISTAVLAALAIAAAAWVMRSLKIRYALIWALVMGVMNPLVFRIGLAKASALGVLLLIAGLSFAVRRRPWPLAIVAFLYVWTHGGWPALLALGTLAIVMMSWGDNVIARSEPERTTRQSHRNITIGAMFKGLLRFARNDGGKSLLALWSGALAGLVVNPFFPANLKFYWEQIVQIAVVNYQSVIGVGNEWYPYGAASLANDLPLLCLLAVTAIIIFPVVADRASADKNRRSLRVALALSVGALLFLLMTLRSRRHVEYFVPLAVIACAAWFGGLSWPDWRTRARRHAVVLLLLAGGIIAMTVVYAGASLDRAKKDLAGGYPFTLYQKATQYLKSHTASGEVIVHADWDEMPPLFYWDDYNRYVMGLDPTFMYSANRDRYWRYVNFTLGKATDPLGVMKELGARYVLSDSKHGVFNQAMEKTGLFKKVYSDDDAYIYLLQ